MPIDTAQTETVAVPRVLATALARGELSSDDLAILLALHCRSDRRRIVRTTLRKLEELTAWRGSTRSLHVRLRRLKRLAWIDYSVRRRRTIVQYVIKLRVPASAGANADRGPPPLAPESSSRVLNGRSSNSSAPYVDDVASDGVQEPPGYFTQQLPRIEEISRTRLQRASRARDYIRREPSLTSTGREETRHEEAAKHA